MYATGAIRLPAPGEKQLLLDLSLPEAPGVPAARPGEIGYVAVSIEYRLMADDNCIPPAIPTALGCGVPDSRHVTGAPDGGPAVDAPARTSFIALLTHHPELAGILAAALALRVQGLTDWWLNADEGTYYSIMTRAHFSDFWADLMHHAHPPLYYLLLRVASTFTWNVTAFRALSVVCGLCAILCVWAVARALAGGGTRGRVAGFVAAMLLAFSPAAVEQSAVIRPYMLQIVFLGGSSIFLLRYLDSARIPDIAGYTLLLVLALLTHYSSVLAGGVLALVVLHDGVGRGFARVAWQRLAAVHVAPALVVLALYAFHLRHVADSALADDAFGRWLSYYLIDSPGDAWLAFLGFQHLIGSQWMRGATALFLLVSIATSIAVRDVRPAVIAAGGLLVATLAAVVDVYPFGSTRHSAWLLTFVVPVLGWLAAVGFDHRGTRAGRIGIGAAAAILALGGPIGEGLGEPRAPGPPTERVLRREDLVRMVGLLDPQGEPELVLMSMQTFYLLSPFYTQEREAATFSADGSIFRFDYGRRTIVVSQVWDFAAGPDRDQPGHLAAVLGQVHSEFPDLNLDDRETASILIGGWLPPAVDELRELATAHELLRSLRAVPGLFAFEVDLQPLRRVLGTSG